MHDATTRATPARSRRRGRRGERCPGCGLHTAVCVCARLPRLSHQTRLVLVSHHEEAQRPSNTGRLLECCLTACSRLTYQPRREGLPAWESFGPGAAVLFPEAEAQELATWRQGLAPGLIPTLVLPDGTWSEAAHMRRRIPAVAALPAVKLPPGPASRFRLRSSPRPEALCTLEAGARALGALEDPALEVALRDVLEAFVVATLEMRRGLTG
jgi:DTW domain-containing protein YfiP